MSPRRALFPWSIVTAAAIFAAAIVWPTVALVVRCVSAGEAPSGGFTYSTRQLGLFWRSIWLASAGVILSVILSLPGAYLIGRMRNPWANRWLAGALLCILLCPPTIYAFGWDALLPARIPNYARCIGIWGTWAWPIPAALIGLAWSRSGREAFESARLVISAPAAFVRVALPLLFPFVALGALILFVLFFSDYGVPHASLLIVYATELLTWASSSARPMDVVWPALPAVVLTPAALCAVAAAWRRGFRFMPSESTVPRGSVGIVALLVVASVFVVSWVIPMFGLLSCLSQGSAVVEAFRVYYADLGWSLSTAGLAGLLCVWMGLGIAVWRTGRSIALIWMLVLGALPGTLVGEALVAAYNRPATWWIYDSWLIVVMSYVARFAWIGLLLALAVGRTASRELVDQARTDGAGSLRIFWSIHVLMAWPMLVCGAAVVAALATAEVAASSLVRVPAFSPVSHIVIEKFHRFEVDMLVSLSLWLVAVALVPCMILVPVLGRAEVKPGG